MEVLATKYMGLKLQNPIIIGASKLTSNVETIRRLEKNGAGAIVTKSLFEEQIQLERFKFEEDMEKNNYKHPEMITTMPDLEHAGPSEHLMWVKETKKNVNIPVIASLNAVNNNTWMDYAKGLQDTGADALELNMFHTLNDINLDGRIIEERQIQIVKQLKKEINIPISVKLSVLYSNPCNFISKLDNEGVDSVVLFNRFFEPEIDINEEKNIFPFNLSNKNDHRIPLRYTGLLYGVLKTDICASTGIFDGEDVVKLVLAGAKTVQLVSTLYKNQITHLQTMIKDIIEFMHNHKYSSLDDFRGKLSKQKLKDPWAYKRDQYVKLLLNPKEIIENYSQV